VGVDLIALVKDPNIIFEGEPFMGFQAGWEHGGSFAWKVSVTASRKCCCVPVIYSRTPLLHAKATVHISCKVYSGKKKNPTVPPIDFGLLIAWIHIWIWGTYQSTNQGNRKSRGKSSSKRRIFVMWES
jgi:hypothetical protein